MKLFRHEQYLISVLTSHNQSLSSSYAEIHVLFKQSASKYDIIKALVHSYLIRSLLAREGYKSRRYYPFQVIDIISNINIIQQTLTVMNGSMNEMCHDDCTVYEDYNDSKDKTDGVRKEWEVFNLAISCEVIHKLCEDLIHHKEWLLEEMHLETRKARIKIEFE